MSSSIFREIDIGPQGDSYPATNEINVPTPPEAMSLEEQISWMNHRVFGSDDTVVPPADSDPRSHDSRGGATRRFRSRAEDKHLPAPKWLIEGLIPENADVAIYAPFAALKTFVAIDLAFSIALGCKALGSFDVPERGPVFFFAGEGYHAMTKKRAVAWEIEHGLEPYAATDIWLCDGVPLTTDDALIEQDILEIEELLDGKKAKLFVIDTMNRALNGQDEDKSHVAARYLQTVKRIRERIGGTSLTISHMGKDPQRGERGSTGFPAGFDTILWVEKCVKDEDTGIITIQILVRKQKDAEDGQRYYMQTKRVWTDDGDSLVLIPCTETEGRDALETKSNRGISAEDVRAALRHLTPGGGHVGTTQLARHLAETLNRKENSVVKALAGNRGERQKFHEFVFGDPRNGAWCLPGRTMNDMDDPLIDILRNRDR